MVVAHHLESSMRTVLPLCICLQERVSACKPVRTRGAGMLLTSDKGMKG